MQEPQQARQKCAKNTRKTGPDTALKWVNPGYRTRWSLCIAMASAVFCSSITISYADVHQTFEERVIEAILENPEVIVLALGKLKQAEELAQKEKSKRVVADVLPELFQQKDGVMSPAVVEFFDYRCGYCTQVAGEVSRIEREHPGAVKYIELPILGPESEALSRFALGVKLVHGQQSYRDFHEALMAADGQTRTARGAARIATNMGFDAEHIQAKSHHPTVTQELASNREIAAKLGIGGTPTFVSRAGVHYGTTTFEDLKSMLEEEPT